MVCVHHTGWSRSVTGTNIILRSEMVCKFPLNLHDNVGGYSTTISPVNSLLLAGPKAQIWWYQNPQGQWLIACSLWSTFHRQFPSPHCHQNSNGPLSWLAWHSTPLHSSCGWEGGRRMWRRKQSNNLYSIIEKRMHEKIILPLLHTKSAWITYRCKGESNSHTIREACHALTFYKNHRLCVSMVPLAAYA